MINAPFYYTGEVTVTTNGKRVKTKNSGTSAMFTLIHNFLATHYSNYDKNTFSLDLPGYMSIIDVSKKSDLDSGKLSYTHYTSSQLTLNSLEIVNRSPDAAHVSFKSILRNSNMLSNFPTDTNATVIVLLVDQRKDKILAYSVINSSVFANTKDQQLAQSEIEWKLIFGNSPTESVTPQTEE